MTVVVAVAVEVEVAVAVVVRRRVREAVAVEVAVAALRRVREAVAEQVGAPAARHRAGALGAGVQVGEQVEARARATVARLGPGVVAAGREGAAEAWAQVTVGGV